MQVIKRLLAGAVILGIIMTGLAVSSAARAGTVPVVYGTQVDGWHAHVRPATIYFGNGGSPFITNLQWKAWGMSSAWGTGKLWIIKSNCAPLYKCPYYSRWVGVYLNTVRWHNGTRYFARMAAEFFVAGKARWDVGWIGSSGFWRFPAVWPYF